MAFGVLHFDFVIQSGRWNLEKPSVGELKGSKQIPVGRRPMDRCIGAMAARRQRYSPRRLGNIKTSNSWLGLIYSAAIALIVCRLPSAVCRSILPSCYPARPPATATAATAVQPNQRRACHTPATATACLRPATRRALVLAASSIPHQTRRYHTRPDHSLTITLHTLFNSALPCLPITLPAPPTLPVSPAHPPTCPASEPPIERVRARLLRRVRRIRLFL